MVLVHLLPLKRVPFSRWLSSAGNQLFGYTPAIAELGVLSEKSAVPATPKLFAAAGQLAPQADRKLLPKYLLEVDFLFISYRQIQRVLNVGQVYHHELHGLFTVTGLDRLHDFKMLMVGACGHVR